MAWEFPGVASPPTSCPRTSSARASPMMQEIKNRPMPNRHELPYPAVCRRREGEVNRITRFPRRNPELDLLAWRDLLAGEPALLISLSTFLSSPIRFKIKERVCHSMLFAGIHWRNPGKCRQCSPGLQESHPSSHAGIPRLLVQNLAAPHFRARGRWCCLDKLCPQK